MKPYVKPVLIVLLSLSIISNVNAQVFKKVVHAVTHPPIPHLPSPPPVLTTPITAPVKTIETTAKVVTGKEKPKDAVKEYREIAAIPVKQTAEVIQAVATVRSSMDNYITQRVGHTASFVIDLGDFAEHYTLSTAASTTTYSDILIEKGGLRYILGIPLAAAIREARERFKDKAMPIPDDVKIELKKRGFDPAIVDMARYAIGTCEIALPNFVIGFEKYFEQTDMAVTVDNIIVFPRDPGTKYTENCTWWAHELTHVQQYRNLGIEGFAYTYSRDLLQRKAYVNIQMEAEAIAHATQITQGNNCYADVQAQRDARRLAQKSAIVKRTTPDTTHYFTNILKPEEKYIAKVHVPVEPNGGFFLVTNEGRIIGVDPMTGKAYSVGRATRPAPPNAKHYAWIFDLPGGQFHFGVTQSGVVEKT